MRIYDSYNAAGQCDDSVRVPGTATLADGSRQVIHARVTNESMAQLGYVPRIPVHPLPAPAGSKHTGPLVLTLVNGVSVPSKQTRDATGAPEGIQGDQDRADLRLTAQKLTMDSPQDIAGLGAHLQDVCANGTAQAQTDAIVDAIMLLAISGRLAHGPLVEEADRADT